MLQEVFYKKKGDKYVPVLYSDNTVDALPEGTFLVNVRPNRVSKEFNVDPMLAPMIAAGKYAEDDMAKAILVAAEAKPKSKAVTPAQRKAWDNCKEAFNNDHYMIVYPSVHDVVIAGIEAMQEEAAKMLTNPSVKKAYEDFLLVWKLAK